MSRSGIGKDHRPRIDFSKPRSFEAVLCQSITDPRIIATLDVDKRRTNFLALEHNAAIQRHIDAGILPLTAEGDGVGFVNCRRASLIPDPVLRITNNDELTDRQQETALLVLKSQVRAAAESAKSQVKRRKLAQQHKKAQRYRRKAGIRPSPPHVKKTPASPAPSSIADLQGRLAQRLAPSPPPAARVRAAAPRRAPAVRRPASGKRKAAAPARKASSASKADKFESGSERKDQSVSLGSISRGAATAEERSQLSASGQKLTRRTSTT